MSALLFKSARPPNVDANRRIEDHLRRLRESARIPVDTSSIDRLSPQERLAMRPAHVSARRTSRDLEREHSPASCAGVPNEPVPSRCAKCRSLDHATRECELSGLDLEPADREPRRQIGLDL